MAIDLGIRIMQVLDSIGIKGGSYLGKASNVKKAFTGGKPTFFKPYVLETLRANDGTFSDALKLIEEEAVYIANATDVEKMAFLNNLMEYKSLGGPQKTKPAGIVSTNAMEDFKKTQSELKKALEDLQSTTEKNKNKALEDLDTFLETGGQPFKKKDDKFLGGSMHEEGQLRTGIRQFLQNEYKNGRLNLNETDKFRVMQYSPMTEDDPILVFKKIYGDEAYKKAGTFPGAFEIGENFKHYEEIFRNNMGEDLLKVKDKKYVGDGKLVLTEMEEIKAPTPDDPDIPFATGGRASFAGGNLVSKFIALIVKKEPIEAMKEVNKVIGKKGKYKNLTQKDIDKIVADTEDHIFQRDPDNLYVYDDGKTVFDDDLNKEQLIEKESRAMDKADEMNFEDSIKEMEGLGATQTAERFKLKQKYPGITDDLLNKILIDDNPQRKAEVLATIDEAFRMMEKGKGTEEIIETFKNTSRTKNSTGGRAGYYSGGQAMIEPDLSDIGHGSDSLMARTRLTAPGSQATTSTGLNYLLGEDNDNTRVPFNEGLLVPPSKPYTTDQFEKDSMTLLKGMYGTGPESNTFLYNKMIEKGNMLRKQGVERETVIEIIRNNKDKINAFLETQTTSPKNFKGLESFEMKADGGRIGYATKGKVDLADLESLKGLKSDSGEAGLEGLKGLQIAGARPSQQRNRIKNKVISSFIYAVDNMDQEKSTYVKNLFNGALQVGYETDTSGIKTDIFEKVGIVPINSETIYSTILNLDLPKEIKAEMSAISDKAGTSELSASLKKNNMGITWDDQSQEIKGEYIFTLGTDGNTKIQPIVTKNQDSQISKEVKIDQAIGDGTLNFTLNESDIGNASGSSINYQNDNVTLFADKQSDDYGNTANIGGTVDIPLYLLNKEEKPYISAEINKNLDTDFESKMFSGSFPITDNLKLYGSRYEDDDGFSNDTRYGLEYNFDKPIGDYGNFFTRANIDNQGDYGINFGIAIPFGEQEKKAFNYTTNNPEEAFSMYKNTDGFKYEPNVNVERMPPRIFAEGGIAGLRQGYNKGNIVDKGRRGFLKLLGVTAGGVAALKTGLVKLLGKDSGAISKKVIDEVIIDGSTGAPAWLQPLVNKALREGADKTKNLAYKDAQTVKRLDTPTGQVDVYYDVRTGEVEIDYIGGNTALGESVNMRYTPGIADEGTKGKPADEFSATESVPEGRMTGPDDYNIEMGENTVDEVGGLYSDTSELAELGGQKPIIKDIVETVKKKKVLKKMENDPAAFANENLPPYDY